MRNFMLHIFVSALLLSSCATTPPLNLQDVDTAITPGNATAQIETLRGKKVLWGGIIVSSRNLQNTTQFEILAYPLDSNRRPLNEREPLGRFIADHNGYLETVDYAPGRELTMTGTLAAVKEGKIDESAYHYPAINVEQLRLWPKSRANAEPRINFGFGVMFHN